ncbi:MFS transporter [Rhizobium sp. C4]|uniref:MFS transporter n=1 Tax=Rhizobium sp. C4 TaxID=1349800 RepID=UPI001E4F4549|nr:MFS transporter [Rhizobium sp. C4]MCD2172798.1 MFS transporter [Rhizobium sp. C4]
MNTQWLVGNPSRTNMWSALWVGSVGLLVLGLQPILLGVLLTEGRVNFDQLALAATVEILAIGIGSVLSAFLLGSGAVRIKAAVFLVLTAIFNHATVAIDGATAVIVSRGLAGLAEGGLVAFAVELIARARHPGRIGGYFVSLQTLGQAGLAALMALWFVSRWGSVGGFDALAIVSLASLAVVFLLPESYGPLPKPADQSSSGLWRPAPLTALLAIFCFYMFLGSLWAFLEPLGGEAGIAADVVGLMVSVSLFAQILGATTSTAIEARLPFRPVLAIASLLACAIALTISLHPQAVIFWCLAMAIGFIWLFVVPFQIRIAVDADASRGAALVVPAAQLFGAALGPAGASAFVETGSSVGVAYFAAASAVASFVFVILNGLTRRPAH